MRPRVLILCCVFAASVGLIVGCGGSSPPAGGNNANNSSAPKDDPNADVGASLYKVAAAPVIPVTRGGADALLIHAVAQFEERQVVSAEADAKIELIATPLAKGEAFDPNDPMIVYHPRDMKREQPYRRLNDGDPVKKDQILCYLDDQLWSAKMTSAEKTKAAVAELRMQAGKGVELTRDRLVIQKKGRDEGVVSQAEYLQDLVTLSRFMENLAQAAQTLAKADSDEEEAKVMVRRHRIISSVDGVIRNISKRPGEFVKAGEKILELQATEKVRLEGNLDVQYFPLIRRGMPVSVEPAVPNPPAKSHAGHRNEVTGLAVAAHPGRPLIVSSGADGSAIVWDPNRGGAGHNLQHPVAVRCVACTPAAAKPFLVVTGSDDGKVRVWDVSNPDALPAAPKAEPADAHTSAVQAVAFSPDGKYFATAAGREVFVWESEGAKKLYVLPAEHRDTITSLSFTPQATLVTAAKDRTIKVWKLGAEKGAVAKTIDHRAGAVDVLGVTRDGGRVLFDQDKSRIDLVSLADKQTVGQITNPGDASSFATLAAFSADDSLIVTTGSEGDLRGTLQVWRTPAAGGRGSEVTRLMTPKRVPATCVTFGQDADRPFLAVGTSAGTVHVWYPRADAGKVYTGKVTYVDSTDPRYVTVRVEMNNKELGLLDRSTATIIVDPAAK